MRIPSQLLLGCEIISGAMEAGEAGFTLIELSITLVIIGLIVGGILVGQDMIKAAEIRATITQIQKYDAAMNTFRNRYNYIPGDMPSTVAAQFGFFNVTGPNTNAQGYGDGNGLIENCGGGGWSSQCGEPLIFWRHLTDASLIDGNFGTTTAGDALSGSTGGIATPIPTAPAMEVVPPAKLGRGNYILLYSAGAQNYFEITGLAVMTTAGALTTANSLTANLTPIEAYTIDLKIDDGLPQSGSVQAMFDPEILGTPAPFGPGNCVNLDDLYNIFSGGIDIGNMPLCQLSIRFN
jgi:prepilin-type N-terminal cleavage/methylation domain-containing protein